MWCACIPIHIHISPHFLEEMMDCDEIACINTLRNKDFCCHKSPISAIPISWTIKDKCATHKKVQWDFPHAAALLTLQQGWGCWSGNDWQPEWQWECPTYLVSEDQAKQPKPAKDNEEGARGGWHCSKGHHDAPSEALRSLLGPNLWALTYKI